MRDGARLAPQGVVWITPEWPEINLTPPPNGRFGSDCVEKLLEAGAAS